MIFRIYIIFILAVFFSCQVIAEDTRVDSIANPDKTGHVARIGVLAFRGVDLAYTMWSPTAKYLSEAIPETSFSIVPLTLDNIRQAVKSHDVDFILTNSASYAELEANYGITRIATLRNRRQGGLYTRFGAIILSRADRDDIDSLSDLKNKSFMAVHKNAFGGWWMAWREFKLEGIDPYDDLDKIEFAGFPHDKIILAVRNGSVDAGTVRTDVLERMARSGEIKIDEFKILNSKQTPGFPFAHSTMLYPEWPFSIVKETSSELAQKVAIALLNMKIESTPALAANSGGWTVPLDYQPVHDLMKELRVGPYVSLGMVNITKVLKQYWQWILLTGVLLIFLAGLTTHMVRLNRKLKLSEKESIAQQKRLRALYDVDSITGLSYDEQITEVLKVGCVLLGTEIGRVCEIDVKGQRNIVRNVITPEDLDIRAGAVIPLEKTFCNVTFAENKDVSINHAGRSDWKDKVCYQFSHLESYIATTITVNGEKYGTINYSSRQPRQVKFKETDMDLVKLMGRRVSVILERKLAQEEIIKSKIIAEEANSAKSAFLANMSHEIRTPLTSIIGFGESLLDSRQDMEQRIGSIKTIVRNGKHLLQLINDILDLSKVEAQKIELEKLNFSFFQIINELDSLIRMQSKEQGLDFNINYHFPLPATVYSEPLRLKQVLLNLCSNAIKFTEQGSVTLSLKCDSENEKMKFSVIDTGIGLTSSHIKKVFKPFTQADSSTTRRFGGTGLGLSLSKQLVEILGGSLAVESSIGVGSKFYFEIDTGDLSNSTFVNSKEEILVGLSTSHSALTVNCVAGDILLAEDNHDNQVLISMYLEAMGTKVTIVSNGQAAVDAIKGKNYDLILMDMQMPIMDGMEAVSEIRSMGYKRPIVALTANAMKEDKIRCLENGFDDFVTKPIDRKLLNQVVIKYLSNPNNIEATGEDTSDPIVSALLEDDPGIEQLVVGFVINLKATIQKAERSLEEKNWADLKSIIHQIKGLGGGYGYSMLTELAAKIEFQIISNNYHEVENLFKSLKGLYKRMWAGLPDGAHNASKA